MKQNVLLDKTFQFAVEVVKLARQMQMEDREYVLSRQLLRSATSIGANVEEALAAHSTADFISKLTIAQKEARETRYWLRLITATEIRDCSKYLNLIDEINKIIAAIILTSKKNMDKVKSNA